MPLIINTLILTSGSKTLCYYIQGTHTFRGRGLRPIRIHGQRKVLKPET